ncbi:PepSY-like domain-containing protein [Flammeovirga kamogawensis]|uniref:PepSY-like domain-containing protein n=1 Tax=Flammeovirga kamogawensis TaxID=373891 RepID=A0ABX8GPF5_9BACT|nr:PepSY-like domain-containing protein [Flammeovirga kamogawensis]MBB6463484.1 hypothetical protein [Flammeovirga kamogawensis]QWG05590.1 PepSY-like domain-containing protein [Flammeovirga kamogawensis]TRX67422.1 hypothetical protein EO216_04400 [Flammeovirga kamogawensis]
MINFTKIFFALIASLLFASCQVKQPSVVIQSNLDRHFPEAKDVVWELEGDEWEAEFTMHGIDCEVEYSKDGDWIETELSLNENQVPENIISAVEKEGDFDIAETEVTITAEVIIYGVLVKQDEKEKVIYISEAGVILEIEELA